MNRKRVWAVSGGVLLVAIAAVAQSGITDIWFAATGAESFDASKAQYMKNDVHMTSAAVGSTRGILCGTTHYTIGDW